MLSDSLSYLRRIKDASKADETHVALDDSGTLHLSGTFNGESQTVTGTVSTDRDVSTLFNEFNQPYQKTLDAMDARKAAAVQELKSVASELGVTAESLL